MLSAAIMGRLGVVFRGEQYLQDPSTQQVNYS